MAARIRPALVVAFLTGFPALAQETTEFDMPNDEIGAFADDPKFEPDLSQPGVEVTRGIEARRGSGAVLRGLDKITGRSKDLPIKLGESVTYGRLEIRLGECRYPASNPASDAYAQLVISDVLKQETVYSGWMIASSPALSALDDARYDIWVISCNND